MKKVHDIVLQNLNRFNLSTNFFRIAGNLKGTPHTRIKILRSNWLELYYNIVQNFLINNLNGQWSQLVCDIVLKNLIFKYVMENMLYYRFQAVKLIKGVRSVILMLKIF